MKSPITGKEMLMKQETIETDFRKEKFEVVYHYYLCEDSGEKFEDERLTQLNLSQVYNQYRNRYNIPFPEEIVSLREQYGLSATKMAEVLRFGINIYRNYENGEIPNASNALILEFAKDPVKFKEMIISSDALNDKEKERTLVRVEELISKRQLISFDLENYFMAGKLKANDETGYKRPDLEKFSQMVIFFSEKVEPYKTKLNKMLFYADFYHFKKTGRSISGAKYRAIDMGPVPNNFQSIFEYLEANNLVEINRVKFNEAIGERFKRGSLSFNKELFTPEELKTLHEVVIRFGKMTTDEIIDISHEEDAWRKSFENGKSLISYRESFRLKAI
jgi:uncharacterized phage-associated protein